MCSTNHSNWVTFEDDNTPLSSPQKPLQSPGLIKASVPRPNGLKLVLPPIRDTSWSFNSSLESPQSSSSLSGSSYVPCNTPFCTPVSGVPSSASPFHSNTWEKNDFFRSLSSTPNTSVHSTAPEALHQTSDGPTPFPSFQGNSGHYNPFWDGSRHSADVDSSSSDSESENSLPRFFIRTKDGDEPPRDHLQSSFSYVCHKLEGLRAHEAETEKDGERRLSCKSEVLSEGSSQFVPRGLFRSQKRDGWSVLLRIPEKKNRMSSRQWGPIYLRLLPGGVLQMYYEKGLEKPFKEFQLLPQCRLSDLKLESYGEPRKVLSVKVEHFSYTEKKRYHPKLEVNHEAEAEELLKFGSTVHDDMEDLVVSIEEEIFKLCIHHQQRRHYEEQELSLQITDHIWVQLDKFGEVMERTAFTQIHCLAFLNGLGDCFLALNDLGLLRFDSSYGSEDDGELWMEIADCHFHRCVNETEFQRSRLIKFSPPEACRVELMRYKTAFLGCTEIPFSIKAVVTVQGAYVELQAFLNMSATFLSTASVSDTNPLCENVVIRVPVPGDWVKVTQTVALLRQRSLKARMNRNACLGAVSAADSQPVMQVTIGTVKYENVYSAVVWRIDRLPAKNTAVDHPHSFSCKLELGSDQEIPSDWYPFVTMECEIMGAVVSQTRVKSLGTANDIQPQKHVTSWTRYHCQAKLYLSIIDDVIESMRELFLDEGLEDRILDDLRHLWESKMMQSKAMEDFRKNNINSSNFVLQLPANYSQTDQELTASVVIPANQSIHSFQRKSNSEALATFSLPAGLSYPVQIPAGVTLQTASGQLYKVNVPVVVTQAPAGQPPVSQSREKVTEQREAPAPQSAAAPPNATYPQEVEPSSAPSAPATPVTQLPHPKTTLPPGRESSLSQQPPAVPAAETSQLEGAHSPEPEVTLQEKDPSPQQPEPLNLSVSASPCSQLLDFQISSEEALIQSAELKTRDIDDILKEVIEEEREKAERARNLMPVRTDNQAEDDLGLDLDYNYSELSDIVQLDGPAGNSDMEEEEGVPLEENDFLGIINAEAIKALQEGDGSSDGNSISSSDSEEADELANVEEEDPLNSGDDVIEQDIPDLFDTDNVIVCQYDKIHRSKNRWKFHLKDGVMCYGGRDYVFSKAVGEAEW
ncbi:stonin-1 isoform X2 [Epinephelus fuscoguttatus]|uniref:stonin-1 isoform X2 n=1 Tax=Epinephelus fuscoguttatus TaxID=293821 RepID=UPI0020D11434|nr:stonin-1 isoform X2 [Epinephelus fuscoguttatus]